jgi:hypothetical protein
MEYPEHNLQKLVIRYLRLAVPRPRCIWSVDHARKATMMQRIRLKERGCYAGIHDTFVLYDRQLITMELKVGKNGPTAGQDEFADFASEAGARCFVVRSIDDVEAALRKCGVPVLATTQHLNEKVVEWDAKPKPKRASKQRAPRPSQAAINRHNARMF